MDTEVAYLGGHENTINLQLKASSSAVSITSVANITATFGTVKVSGSSSKTSGAIVWSSASFSTGEMRITVKSYSSTSAPLIAGKYNVPIVVYSSAASSSGIVWDLVPITLKVSPEGS